MATKAKVNGGMVIPREAVPSSRLYSDKYGEVWREVAKLRPSKSYVVDPKSYGSTVNALRCSLRKAKMGGRVPQDIIVRFDGTRAYFMRGEV